MEDSGRFLARIPRGLGLMEDSGRFRARIPRGLGLMRIQEGSEPEYLGG